MLKSQRSTSHANLEFVVDINQNRIAILSNSYPKRPMAMFEYKDLDQIQMRNYSFVFDELKTHRNRTLRVSKRCTNFEGAFNKDATLDTRVFNKYQVSTLISAFNATGDSKAIGKRALLRTLIVASYFGLHPDPAMRQAISLAEGKKPDPDERIEPTRKQVEQARAFTRDSLPNMQVTVTGESLMKEATTLRVQPALFFDHLNRLTIQTEKLGKRAVIRNVFSLNGKREELFTSPLYEGVFANLRGIQSIDTAVPSLAASSWLSRAQVALTWTDTDIAEKVETLGWKAKAQTLENKQALLDLIQSRPRNGLLLASHLVNATVIKFKDGDTMDVEQVRLAASSNGVTIAVLGCLSGIKGTGPVTSESFVGLLEGIAASRRQSNDLLGWQAFAESSVGSMVVLNEINQHQQNGTFSKLKSIWGKFWLWLNDGGASRSIRAEMRFNAV